MKQSSKTIRLAQMGLLAAVAVILVAFVQDSPFPRRPFSVYDMADVPVLIGTLLYGTLPWVAILLVVSVIQAFLLGVRRLGRPVDALCSLRRLGGAYRGCTIEKNG